MQRVVYVHGSDLTEVNQLLANGWKVVMITSVPDDNGWHISAYFVLQK